MWKVLSIYAHYFLQFFKARMEYKADFVAGILSSIVISVTGLLFVIFLIDGSVVQSLRGWSRDEVLFIYGYSFLATALFSMVSLNLYGFGDRYIIQGQFDRILLRPLSSLPQVLFESFNLESFGNFVVGIVVLVTATNNLGIELAPLDYLWIVVSACFGAVILLSVFVVITSLSFHFEDRLGITAPVFNMLAFGRYPLNIFHWGLQLFLSVVLPFGFIAFYPATYFFKGEGLLRLWYLIVPVAVIWMAIAKLSWEFGVSRYSSTGS